MGTIIRSKYWGALGLVVLLALVLFLAGALPKIRANNKRLDTLSTRADELERYRREGAKNPRWVTQQEEVGKELKNQRASIEQELLERDALLERHFRDPETGEKGPLEYGQWAVVYEQKMANLYEKLEDSVTLVLSRDPLEEANLGRVWRSVPLMHGLEKEYWIQQTVVDAIAELNSASRVVPVFGQFRFLAKPERLLSPAHAGNFRCRAFSLEVAMQFKFATAFLKKLLEAPDPDNCLGIEITSVKISRFREGGREGVSRRERILSGRRAPGRVVGGEEWPSTPASVFEEGLQMPSRYYMGRPSEWVELEEEAPARKPEVPLPDRMVSVRVLGYVPDYEPPEEKEKGVARRTATGRIERGTRRQP